MNKTKNYNYMYMKPLSQRGMSGQDPDHPNNEILKENDKKESFEMK